MAKQLPVLAEVERLSPRVIRILGGNPGKFTLQGTNTYLVGTGSSRILIDTAQGLPAWKESLAAVLASEHCTIGTLLLTHWHHDHVGGVSDLLALCPHAALLKHPGSNLAASMAFAAEKYGLTPDPHYSTYSALADGQLVAGEGATLRALLSPGHTSDHTAFVLQEEGDALFSGDAVLGHGTAVFEDLPVYLRSLNSLRDTCGEGARLYPAHGAVIENGRAKVEEYLAHRRMREEEILAALGSGGGGGGGGGESQTGDQDAESNLAGGPGGEPGMTPAEIVRIVYKDTPQELHLPAEGGVRRVLAKLEGEGRVFVVEGKWKVNGRAAL